MAVLLLGLTGVLRPFRSLAEKTLIIPLKQKIYDWQRSFKKDLSGCELKNVREIAELKLKIASLTEENQAQRRLLSAPLPKNWQFVAAKVIEVKDEMLMINLGKEDGVKKDMVAVWENNFLGRVVTVSDEASKVKLPSFLDEKLSVKLISSSSTVVLGRGLLVGRGLGQMKVEQILSSEAVTKGNLVTIGVDGEDLLVGEIEEIFEKKGEVFKTAQVGRLYNPEELNTIFLVRGKI